MGHSERVDWPNLTPLIPLVTDLKTLADLICKELSTINESADCIDMSCEYFTCK